MYFILNPNYSGGRIDEGSRPRQPTSPHLHITAVTLSARCTGVVAELEIDPRTVVTVVVIGGSD